MTRSRSASSWPTRADLENAPALATLAVLHDTLDLLGGVLCAMHPELLEGDRDDDEDHAARRIADATIAAERLLVVAESALDAIDAYRAAVRPLPGSSGGDGDEPF